MSTRLQPRKPASLAPANENLFSEVLSWEEERFVLLKARLQRHNYALAYEPYCPRSEKWLLVVRPDGERREYFTLDDVERLVDRLDRKAVAR